MYPHHPEHVVRHPLSRRLRVLGLYTRAVVGEFRYTLLSVGVLVFVGACLHRLSGSAPRWIHALYYAWMAMFAQPKVDPPPWYLEVVYCVYPILGFVFIGEGVVRLALLMMSRRHGEKEWMKVMASTYRDHVILCGLGHLGIRVLQQLVAAGADAVVVEKDEQNPFLSQARRMHVPILVRDMKEDEALLDAGIEHARAIIISTNDDIANLEVAIDARRMNPAIRVVMRLFDQQLASKIGGVLTVDAAFSSSALAAPVVAAMSLQTRVVSTLLIGGVPHVAAEVVVDPGSPLDGRRIADVEAEYAARVLARTPRGGTPQSPPAPDATIAGGDTLVVHTAAARLPNVAAAAQAHPGAGAAPRVQASAR